MTDFSPPTKGVSGAQTPTKHRGLGRDNRWRQEEATNPFRTQDVGQHRGTLQDPQVHNLAIAEDHYPHGNHMWLQNNTRPRSATKNAAALPAEYGFWQAYFWSPSRLTESVSSGL